MKEKLEKKGILVAFGELFLKSEGVKRIFRRKLENNIFSALKKEKISYKNILSRDRIFIETDSKDIKKAKKIIKNTSGIAWLSESFYFSSFNLKDISKFISINYFNFIKEKESFSVRVKIEKGIIKETKEEIIKEIASVIKNRKVKLKNPSKELNIEIRKCGIFLYFKKEKGLGGLPVSSSGKGLVLMSGGIDSPVSSYLILKRGVEPVWVHFHSFPFVSNKSIKKVEELAKIFLKYQSKLRVYFVPFQDIQLDIKAKSNPSLRVLLYRRKMIEISNIIAEKENCKMLITGESLGQVSSQTIDNISITSKVSKLPILRPVISYDKLDIINVAKKINSFDISIRQQEDCCTLFVPKKSTGSGNLKDIIEIEKKLNKNNIKKIEKNLEFIDFY